MAFFKRYNMDHFGIGIAIRASVDCYCRASRQTGRTTSLVESVKDGDRIIFSNRQEAERVRHLCSDRGIRVQCIVCDPKSPQAVFEHSTPEGRNIFDHSFLEEFYAHVIDSAIKEIDFIERETSGYGEAHRETKRKAQELLKWR